MAHAEEFLHAIRSGGMSEDYIHVEIDPVVDGNALERISCGDITVYKSLGVAAQESITANRVSVLAELERAGTLAQV